MKSPIILKLLLAVVHGAQRLDSSAKGLDRDTVTIKARFEHEGLGFLTVALPSLCDALDRGLAEGRFACPTGFNKIRKGALPRLFSGLLCKVFDKRTGHLREAPDVGAAKILREILRLSKKLQQSDEREETLHQRAVGSFWETDRACAKSFDPRRLYLLSCVSRSLLTGLENIQFDEIVGRHGPGAVAESADANQKWEVLHRAVREEQFDVSSYGLDAFGATSRGYLADSSPDLVPYCLLTGDDTGREWLLKRVCAETETPSTDCARVTSVAKNSQSRRTITIEPCWKMFIQQGLNKFLRESISRDPVLSNCLALTDQSENQLLALEGSLTGDWATIDLTSASDLMSYELVREVFGRWHPGFYSKMIDCRSEFAEYLQKPRALNKFAGMGNALTFPVQSVVFATIAMTAIADQLGFVPSYRSLDALSRIVRVYGDDIVVPTVYCASVIDWIESFGLKVNRAKTFTVGYFRESCGLDVWRGYDLTPSYIRHNPAVGVTAENAAHFVKLSNELWLRGLYEAANVLSEFVEEALGPLPLAAEGCGYLGWVTRTGGTHSSRWNGNLFRWEAKVLTVRSKTKVSQLNSWPALLKSLTTPLIGRSVGHLKRVSVPHKVVLRRRWMPTQVGCSTDQVLRKGINLIEGLKAL